VTGPSQGLKIGGGEARSTVVGIICPLLQVELGLTFWPKDRRAFKTPSPPTTALSNCFILRYIQQTQKIGLISFRKRDNFFFKTSSDFLRITSAIYKYFSKRKMIYWKLTGKENKQMKQWKCAFLFIKLV
jgi:hypothetical protein